MAFRTESSRSSLFDSQPIMFCPNHSAVIHFRNEFVRQFLFPSFNIVLLIFASQLLLLLPQPLFASNGIRQRNSSVPLRQVVEKSHSRSTSLLLDMANNNNSSIQQFSSPVGRHQSEHHQKMLLPSSLLEESKEREKLSAGLHARRRQNPHSHHYGGGNSAIASSQSKIISAHSLAEQQKQQQANGANGKWKRRPQLLFLALFLVTILATTFGHAIQRIYLL